MWNTYVSGSQLAQTQTLVSLAIYCAGYRTISMAKHSHNSCKMQPNWRRKWRMQESPVTWSKVTAWIIPFVDNCRRTYFFFGIKNDAGLTLTVTHKWNMPIKGSTLPFINSNSAQISNCLHPLHIRLLTLSMCHVRGSWHRYVHAAPNITENDNHAQQCQPRPTGLTNRPD